MLGVLAGAGEAGAAEQRPAASDAAPVGPGDRPGRRTRAERRRAAEWRLDLRAAVPLVEAAVDPAQQRACGRRTGCARREPAFAVANWMCVAIEATPTSGRRALIQLMSAARLNGSGQARGTVRDQLQIIAGQAGCTHSAR